MMRLVGLGVIDRTILILCGGKGTRSANPKLPKAIQEINGKTLISLQLAALGLSSRFKVIFIAGWQSEKLKPVIEYEMRKYPDTTWEFKVETKPQGTTKAVMKLVREIPCEDVMIILGDLYINADLGKYFELWDGLKSEVLFLAHPNSHPRDSDLVSYNVSTLKVAKLLSKKRTPTKYDGNMALAGITLAKTHILKKLSENYTDLIDAIFSDPDNLSRIMVLPITDTIMDVGNSIRLSEANRLDSLKSKSPLSALFLDLDGTLLPNQEVKNLSTKIEFDKRVLNSLMKLSESETPIFIVSNQPGIAKGLFSWKDFEEFRTHMESILSENSIRINRWFVCPHHPDSGYKGELRELKIICRCRKPQILFAEEVQKFYKIDLSAARMLGDTEADRGFAESAGISFQKVTLAETLSEFETLTTWQALNLIVDKL